MAVDAHDAATDELDRAEAVAALEDAQHTYRDARAIAEAQAAVAMAPLLRSADVDGAGREDETLDIAYRRAWEVFVSKASPAEVILMQLPDDQRAGGA